MHTLNLLLLAAVAACAVPRPLGPSAAPALSQLPHRMGRQERPFLSDYMVPRMMIPNPVYGYEDSPRANAQPDSSDWLNKEIERINQMEDDEALAPFEEEFSRWMSRDPYMSPADEPIVERESSYNSETITPVPEDVRPIPPPRQIPGPPTPSIVASSGEKKKTFALTPLDPEYYEPENKMVTPKSDESAAVGDTEDMTEINLIAFQPPRKTRQNPNLGRTKNLVAENLDRLKTGLTQENPEGTDKPRHIHVLETTADPADSIYGIAIIVAVGSAMALAIVGFAFGWYTLSKKAKAAADVDYPAYGVTGPTIDSSGDRKLAHSAHMYHYQHQKQQIIAMERNGMDQHNGSVSDPESEEENEEGDYTVYECPGFATTGEMEVKNPLFSEDPTPATPGKCELVKPQPKE